MNDIPQIMEENGKRYRMLQVGETIEEGDEVNILGGWERIMPTHSGCKINDDTKYTFPAGYYRRPIQ